MSAAGQERRLGDIRFTATNVSWFCAAIRAGIAAPLMSSQTNSRRLMAPPEAERRNPTTLSKKR